MMTHTQKKYRLGWLALATSLLLPAVPALANKGGGQVAPGTTGMPTIRQTDEDAVMNQVRLEQRIDAQLPLDLKFRDETGREVLLGEYFRSGKPVMLMMIQYRCTMLCTEQMNILMDSLNELQFTPGKEFTLLIPSIDPREGPELAAEVKKAALERYGRPEAAEGWHFLTTTDERTQRQLAETVGFYYAYDEKTDQYAHPDGVMIVTPSGRVAQYYFRLEYPARDIRYGLIQAAANKIGSPIDKIALLCYHYNPTTGTYGVAFMALLRLMSVALIVMVGLMIVAFRWREAAERRRNAAMVGER